MNIPNVVCLYQQVHISGVVREDYWYFQGKAIPIFVVKLLNISKLKTIYDLPFKIFSSDNKFMTVLANSDNENFSSPVLEKFMGIFAMKNVFKSLSFLKKSELFFKVQNKYYTIIQTHSSLFQQKNFDSAISNCRLRPIRRHLKMLIFLF